MSSNIPLYVLVFDPNRVTGEALISQLQKHEAVACVRYAETIDTAQRILRKEEINTIFADPLNPNIDEASEFIFSIRKTLPEIVFALYIDLAAAEAKRKLFYRGERQRFSHYYTLNKAIPVSSFPDEVDSVLRTCQSDLSWRLSKESLRRLIDQENTSSNRDFAVSEKLEKAQELVARVSESSRITPNKNTVFLSYSFSETEYADGLVPLLKQNGFEVITGKRTNTYIGRAVIDRIRDSEYFLCLMTRNKEKTDGTFTTSPWLLEEKGVALALGKQIVLMIEEGVDDFGGLQGDWQRIHFGPKGFLKAALEAAHQLASYSGRGVDEAEEFA